MEGFNLWANLQNYKRGVLIYTARDLHATLFESPSNCNFDENILVSIELKDNDKLLLGCIYRSPNSDQTNNAQLMFGLRNICTQHSFSHILICGDFNFPQINWNDISCSTSTNHCPYHLLECT